MIFLFFSLLLALSLLGLGSICSGIFYNFKILHKKITTSPQVSILIPAHNEEKKISTTLYAIQNALQEFESPPEIWLALDACSDQTQAIAESFQTKLNLKIVTVSYQSKWKTLQYLANLAKTDWVIFLDAGISFEKKTIPPWLYAMKDPQVIGVAPYYSLRGGSVLQKIFWKIEKKLKQMENQCGGPISVHGAAIAYRRVNLMGVFDLLAKDKVNDFKNDDVMLPLALRMRFPESRIIYLSAHEVFDEAIQDRVTPAAELTRRKRMILGNLQWIRWMVSSEYFNTKFFLLSLRRLLRPFWVAILFMNFISFFILFGSSAFLLLLPIFFFRSAAVASLYAPIYLFFKTDQKFSSWK